jgi:hypothetical protein
MPSSDMRTIFWSLSSDQVAFIACSCDGISRWPLLRAASAGSRPET